MLSCLSASLLYSFTCLSFVPPIPPSAAAPTCLPSVLSVPSCVYLIIFFLSLVSCRAWRPVYLAVTLLLRQTASLLPVRFSLIYYLCLSVFLHLPSSQPMFLSVIPTCKSTQTEFSPCCSVYSCPSLASVQQQQHRVHVCEWGRAMIVLVWGEHMGLPEKLLSLALWAISRL